MYMYFLYFYIFIFSCFVVNFVLIKLLVGTNKTVSVLQYGCL